MNLAAGLLLAATLIAGSVRDQHGAPVVGARVVVHAGSAAVASATTGPDGTFLVDAAGSSVEITCAYCKPLSEAVDEQGIVAAVVTRYDAPFAAAPVDDDIAHLPLASALDLFSLTPFVVVNQTSRTVPGATVTDRNATPFGGLPIIDGAPAYDTTAGVAMFGTVPQGGLSHLSVSRVDRAYLYGNVAEGGTFMMETPGGDTRAAAGSDEVVRASAQSARTVAAASYANAYAGMQAERGAARVTFDTPATQSVLVLSSGAGHDAPSGLSALDSSFSSAALDVRSRGRVDAFARILADHATYDYDSTRFYQRAMWSDAEIEAGVDSHATLAPFLHLDARSNAGSLSSAVTGLDPVAGNLTQSRLSAGVTYRTRVLDAFAAAGTGLVRFRGIVTPDQDVTTSIGDGVLSATYRPSDAWSFHASTSRGYTLQTFAGVYSPALGNPNVPLTVPGNTNETTVEFGDGARVRVSATALDWHATGLATSGVGGAISWQISPSVALRTWLLHETSSSWQPGLVGSAWVTVANGRAFRADVMWMRSLLDRQPRGHLALSIGGRLSQRLDWFASTSSVHEIQQTAVGIRIR